MNLVLLYNYGIHYNLHFEGDMFNLVPGRSTESIYSYTYNPGYTLAIL